MATTTDGHNGLRDYPASWLVVHWMCLNREITLFVDDQLMHKSSVEKDTNDVVCVWQTV